MIPCRIDLARLRSTLPVGPGQRADRECREKAKQRNAFRDVAPDIEVSQYLAQIIGKWHWPDRRHVGTSGVALRHPAEHIAGKGRKQAQNLAGDLAHIPAADPDAQHPHMGHDMRDEVTLPQDMGALQRGESGIEFVVCKSSLGARHG